MMDSYFWYKSESSSSTHNNFGESRGNSTKAKPSYHLALHSIRRPLQPKPMTKKPIAPLPPTPPKIYQVESSNFKQVVQKLTSLPQFHPRRLQNLAPPPLNLLPTTTSHTILQDQQPTSPNLQTTDLYGLVTPTMSPASLAWCSFLLQSPQTSTLQQATTLQI